MDHPMAHLPGRLLPVARRGLPGFKIPPPAESLCVLSTEPVEKRAALVAEDGRNLRVLTFLDHQCSQDGIQQDFAARGGHQDRYRVVARRQARTRSPRKSEVGAQRLAGSRGGEEEELSL